VVEKSKVLVLMDQVLPKRCVLSCYLKMAKDSVAQVELGRNREQFRWRSHPARWHHASNCICVWYCINMTLNMLKCLNIIY